MNDYITTEEVASILRIKSRKVYDLVSKDKIPYKKVMGKLLFSKNEINNWLNKSNFLEKKHELPKVILGSHDPLLEESLKRSNCGIAISFDGSKKGLCRMNNLEGIASGLHIFEEGKDQWNIENVTNKLSIKDFVLMEWAKRSRGLVFKKKKYLIKSINDLHNLNFASRQEGSGTKIYLDYLFKKNKLEKKIFNNINTFYTETDAVMSVFEDENDVTFGLKSEANKFNLDFIELVKERFDIVLDRRSFFEDSFQKLMRYCDTENFKKLLIKFDGYDVRDFGKFHYIS
tara:strand:+ start:81 stop:941 length:861 start_codon:yes stop_codon:yes gene_type:complete